MGAFLILAVAAGATTAVVLSRKRAIAEAFFAAGGTLPGPSKSTRRRQRYWQPVQEGSQGGYALHVVDRGRRGRGWNMNRRTADGRTVPHWGVDIGAAEGTPVRAVATGTVRRVENISGYGKAVVLEHDDSRSSLYGHLSRQNVREGQRVRGGEIIGLVGRTSAGPNGVVPSWGRTMGPHLHFEIHSQYPPDLRGGAQSAQRRGVIEPEGWLREKNIALYANYA